jgi:RNA polymerase sigma-70 factor (ECF subfamily)
VARRQLDPECIAAHLDHLYRAAWALCGSRDEAEDLVQETCARVLARPRSLRSDDPLGYLLRALRNTLAARRRAAGRRPRTVSLAHVVVEPADRGAASRPDELAQVHEAFAAIAALPTDLREALVAVDVVGLSYAEAGRLLGAKESTITTRLFRARGRVAERLAAPEQDRRSAAGAAR